MITEEYCKEILSQYPEYITKEQMYRICHISKKTCLFLLESGLVPNIDSSKKTHRFKIKTTAVIQYLMNRTDYPELYAAPEGFYKENEHKKAYSYGKVYTQKKLDQMRWQYEKLLKKYPDVMEVAQVSEFTGYGKTSVVRWCNQQELKSFFIRRKFKIPKEYLLDFLVSEHYIGIAVKSINHQAFNKRYGTVQRRKK